VDGFLIGLEREINIKSGRKLGKRFLRIIYFFVKSFGPDVQKDVLMVQFERKSLQKNNHVPYNNSNGTWYRNELLTMH
jgi:hypothetical protein